MVICAHDVAAMLMKIETHEGIDAARWAPEPPIAGPKVRIKMKPVTTTVQPDERQGSLDTRAISRRHAASR